MNEKRYDLVDCDAVRNRVKQYALDSSGQNRDRIDRLESHFTSSGAEVLRCDRCGFSSTDSFELCPFCGADDNQPFTVVEDGVQQKSLYFEDDLDRMINRAIKLSGDLRSYFYIGKILSEIKRKGLFRLRRTSTGARVYVRFGTWLRKETPFDRQSAARMIHLAETLTPATWDHFAPNIIGMIRAHGFQKYFGKREQPQLNFNPVLRYLEDQGHAVELLPKEGDDGKITTRLKQEDGTVEKVRIPKELIRKPSSYRRKEVVPENRMERVDLDVGLNRYTLRSRVHPEKEAFSLDDDPWVEIPLSIFISLVVHIVKSPSGKLSLFCEVKKTQ